jgi:hypothetical protein
MPNIQATLQQLPKKGCLAMPKSKSVYLCLTASLFVLMVTGCGKPGMERVHVSGKASYDGKPIEIGQIRFVPISPASGPITIDRIENGAYETATTGGVTVGTHRVELRMYDSHEYETAPRVAGSASVKQLLPDKYNRNSELTLDVPSGSGSIDRDFELTK